MQAVLLARDQRLDHTVSRTARGCRAHRLHARGPGSLGRQAPSPTHTTRHRGSRHPQVPHGMPDHSSPVGSCACDHDRRLTASRACTITATRVATSGRLISSAVKFGICGLLGWRRRSVQAQKPDASKLAISNARANVTRSARRALRKRIGGDDECAGPAALRGLRKLRRSSPSAVAFTTYVRSPSVHERQRDRRTADQRDELAAFTRSPRLRARAACRELGHRAHQRFSG